MLTTKRRTLRAPHEDDLHALFAVYSNSNAMKYWFTPPHEDLSVTKNRYTGAFPTGPIHPPIFRLNWTGLLSAMQVTFQNELGAMLAPDHWRKGFVREAFEPIIPDLRNVTDHDALTGNIGPNNAASYTPIPAPADPVATG